MRGIVIRKRFGLLNYIIKLWWKYLIPGSSGLFHNTEQILARAWSGKSHHCVISFLLGPYYSDMQQFFSHNSQKALNLKNNMSHSGWDMIIKIFNEWSNMDTGKQSCQIIRREDNNPGPTHTCWCQPCSLFVLGRNCNYPPGTCELRLQEYIWNRRMGFI